MDLMKIAVRFKLMREALPLSQSDLAGKLGIQQAAISKIERAIQPPSEPTIKLLDYSFGVKRSWLIDGEGELGPIKKDGIPKGQDKVGEEEETYDDIKAEFQDYGELEFQGMVLEYSEVFNRLKAILKNAPESERYKVRGMIDEVFCKMMRDKKKEVGKTDDAD